MIQVRDVKVVKLHLHNFHVKEYVESVVNVFFRAVSFFSIKSVLVTSRIKKIFLKTA